MLGVMRHVLKDESMPLFDQKERRDLVAIGVSDSETYAKHLASKFSYTILTITPRRILTYAIPNRLAGTQTLI